MKRIVVDPPASDARRERVERKLFEQLAAVRVVERAEAVIPPPRKSRAPLFAFGGMALAAAALALVLLGRDTTPSEPPSPSRVVTPVGGTTQFTVPGALIDARSDTSVEVQYGANGAITLVLGRGSIECDVEHRPNRPPFRVVAGEVAVEVVGTRFTVTKAPMTRVDVARGKVRVIAPGGQWLVEAGEAWPMTQTAAVTAPPAPEPVAEPAPEIEMDAERVTPAKKKAPVQAAPEPEAVAEKPAPAPKEERELARETYRIALKLEETDPKKAAQLYRSIATNGKGMEALALKALAEIQLLKLKQPAGALEALDELKQRFPGEVTQETLWFRYQALQTMGKRDEARGAAADYLRQFPNGAYADRLRSR